MLSSAWLLVAGGFERMRISYSDRRQDVARRCGRLAKHLPNTPLRLSLETNIGRVRSKSDADGSPSKKGESGRQRSWTAVANARTTIGRRCDG